jgi:Protein of unknown function (DUF2946)
MSRDVDYALRSYFCNTAVNCTSMSANVISRTILAMGCRRTKHRRVLGYLLLLMITHGATVAVAHSHGAVTPERSCFATISDAGGSHSDTNHSDHRECVICQLQQQLFNGIVHTPFSILTPAPQIAFISTLTVLYHSSHIICPSGRAPPLG